MTQQAPPEHDSPTGDAPRGRSGERADALVLVLAVLMELTRTIGSALVKAVVTPVRGLRRGASEQLVPAARASGGWARRVAIPTVVSEARRTWWWSTGVALPGVRRRFTRRPGAAAPEPDAQPTPRSLGAPALRRTADSVGRATAQTSRRVTAVAGRTAHALRGEPSRREAKPEAPPSRRKALAFAPSTLPPLREDRRPWVVKAAGVSVGALAGILGLVLVAAAVVPRVGEELQSSMDVALALPEDARLSTLSERSYVYAADGSLLTVLHDEIDREYVPFERIPKRVWLTVLAAEDKRFFEHEGYDLEGIARATFANLRARNVEQGGSTITQQLAKMNFVGDEVTLERKFDELFYAMALEKRYVKSKLLERYLNQVYFGSGAYGIQAAAQEYFRSGVQKLRIDQTAMLAAIVRSPIFLNPRVNPDEVKARRDAILVEMGDSGLLRPNKLKQLLAQPLRVRKARNTIVREPFVVEMVKRELFSNPRFGATREERIERLFSGGLEIHTTIEPLRQEQARAAIEARYPGSPGPTAAIASVDPRNGKILAAARGREFNDDKFDLATQGRRQPGSAFKTFVLAEALRQGFPEGMTLSASSPQEYQLPGELWTVSNYGGASYGDLDLRQATYQSANTFYAQLVQLVGFDNAVSLARELGVNIGAAFGGPEFRGPSLVLGGLRYGVTPLEMASAYGTFANNGEYVKPYLIDNVVRDKRVILKHESRSRQVLPSAVNATLVDILEGNVQSGTGTAAAISGWPVAGKTGTTQNQWDAWFVGFTPIMSTAVWVGYPEGQIVMPGATGGGFAAPLWQDYMSEVLQNREPRQWPEPDGSVEDVFADEFVTVPDVRYGSSGDAFYALSQARLVASQVTVDSAEPVGTVLWQSPEPGASLHPGESVSIGVSDGTPPPPPKPKKPANDDQADEPQNGDDAPADEAPADEPPADEPPADEGGGGNGGGGNGGGGGGAGG